VPRNETSYQAFSLVYNVMGKGVNALYL